MSNQVFLIKNIKYKNQSLNLNIIIKCKGNIIDDFKEFYGKSIIQVR